MLRKILIVCFAIAAVVGGSLAPTDVSARGRGGGGRGGGGFRGGGGRGGGFARGFGRGIGRGFGYGYYPYAYPYYGAYGCWRTVRVYSPYGVRYRRLWVCG